ncbi:hypothetical protein NLI96_g4343 [Meripilus lineatus]|uniref:DUF6535 domain-containing protein n=1 Tax=Meripilus lineatus TaxID=2056292 RepID=A0AAD5VAD2_9APHY|nr:hypothetical protein NLI96_g4343 [Physisporinus lineatus]
MPSDNLKGPSASHSSPPTAIPQPTSGVEMSTDVEMTVIESTTRGSPSPSKKSGHSSPANSRRRSSSPKRKRSLENKIEEGSRENEHQTHDVWDVIVNTGEKYSSTPNLPGDSDPVHGTGPSSQVPAITQSNLNPEAQDPTTHNAGGTANAKVEEEEGLTEVEKQCRGEEKEYPDIVLKPEDCNAWPELSDTLTKHDGNQVDAHYQNIDTLLVLSGLFSAVVTTLIIEAYKQLQQDPADTTVQLLLQISMQLSSLSVNPGFINSTYVPPPSLPFSPRPSAVLVNILWFTSLVLSLVTASLGMLVKQWFREYHSKLNLSPEQYCQVRLFRVRGLRKYKVAEIASFLPILLQIALILFFIGLILFAQSVHASLATVVSIIVAIWLFFVVSTTFLPIMSPSCPYKTPFLKSIFLYLRNLLSQQRTRIKSASVGSYFGFLPDPLFNEESTGDVSNETKAAVWLDTYETIRDVKSWDIAMRCIDLNSPLESLRTLSALVTQKHGFEITHDSNLGGLFDQAQLRLLLKSMTACLRRASSVALKGGEVAWFRSTEVVHFVTLRRLYYAFLSSGGSDTALDKIVDRLTQHEHALSVLHHFDFFCSYIPSQLGLSETRFPEVVDQIQMWIIIDCITGALDSGYGSSARFKCSASLPHLLEMCRISFLCAGRATKDALDSWESEFLQLTVRLAESLQSISYPEENVNTRDVFRAQCALDMAMRLHTKVPGFVDKSLFQALHVCSVKMFDLTVKDWSFVLESHIRTQNNALSTGEVPGSVSGPDWEEVLEGKEYVGFRILDDGNDRDEWYHEDLQSSCKQRIQFMWSKIQWRGIFSRILDDFRIE